MTRRALLNVGLLVLVAALLLVARFEPGVERKPEQPHLTALTSNDVARVRIRQPGGAELSLSRKDGVWMIDAPIVAYANEFRLEPLLRVTEAESYASFAARGQDLKQYQLDPPLAAMTVNDDLELAFGGTEPINNRRYVRVGDTVHLIDDHYYFRLQAGLPAFVSNRLLPPGAQPVRIAAPGFTLSRDAEGRWSASPALEGVSQDAFNSFVDEWKGVQAVEVDRYARDGKEKKVRIEFASGAPIDFQVVESASEVIFGRSDLGVRYHLASDQAHRLLSPPAPESAAKTAAGPQPVKARAAP
jgi:hypothetical protein